MSESDKALRAADDVVLPKPPKRTQRERTARTRRSILDAVIDSVTELGYEATTASEISQRAGVTWGAVVHHFGDKDSLIIAVLEDNFERLIERVGVLPRNLPMDERISVFVDRMWDHHTSREHVVSIELIVNLRRLRDKRERFGKKLERVFLDFWEGAFGDLGLSVHDSYTARVYIYSTFMGLGFSERMNQGSLVGPRELDLVKRTLRIALGVDGEQEAAETRAAV